MLLPHLYYRIKPLVPWSARMAVRRFFAVRKRKRVRDVWPIMPGSERPPEDWPGWPEGKQFALVLTHDVEGQAGLDNCRQLMELEMKLGFRSSFNFIPEGEYMPPRQLMQELTANGFEVGVHDLYHDGKLFLSRSEFTRNAPKINQYLKDWGSVGFRAGFMLHNLDWLHELNIQYDCSTFDVDPFEPKPRGQHTIFPFWVGRHGESRKQKAGEQSRKQKAESRNGDEQSEKEKATTGNGMASGLRPPTSGLRPLTSEPPASVIHHPSSAASDFRFQISESQLLHQNGYVELPYTLPQDSTLFLLHRERHPDLWFQKLDWIAKHGGMALVDVHPDYVDFKRNVATAKGYPSGLYEDFLRYAAEKYRNLYWRALPCKTAAFWVNTVLHRSVSSASRNLVLTGC